MLNGDLFDDEPTPAPQMMRASVGRSRRIGNATTEKSKKHSIKQTVPKYWTRFGVAAKYKAWMCQVAYDTLCEGRTLAAVAARLSVDKVTVWSWRKKYPEFADAIGRGLAVAEDMWAEEKWQEMHPGIYKLQMGQRFDWREKTDGKMNGQMGFTLVQNLGGKPGSPPLEYLEHDDDGYGDCADQ